MASVSIGIVGLGAIAEKIHLPILSGFEGVQITAAAELDPQRAEKIAQKWKILKTYRNFEELYDQASVDAVYICLPNSLHYCSVKGALEKGLHVFCEKPMGINPDEATELVRIAQKKDLVLAVGYNRRLEMNYRKTAQTVNSLVLGRILQVHGELVVGGPYIGWIPSSDWFYNDIHAVLYDSVSHMIDLILYVLSDAIVQVSATGMSTMSGINVYDNIAGSFSTRKGTIGTFNVGWRSGINHDSLTVHGTGGSVFANPLEFEIRYGDSGSLERSQWHWSQAKSILGGTLQSIGRAHIPNKTYFLENRAFLDAIRNQGSPCVMGEDALRVLEVLEAVKESMLKGHQINVHSRVIV